MKAVIFDLDGTLVHSAPDLRAAVNHMLFDMGREPIDLPTIISFIGNGVEKLVERSLIATGGIPITGMADPLGLFRAFYADNLTTQTTLYPGVQDWLNAAHAKSVPMGICTNKPHQAAIDVCYQLDISKYFGVIIGAQDNRAKKPDPAMLLHCAEVLNVELSETIYVGDSETDFETAQNANVAFRLFNKGYRNGPIDVPAHHCFDDWSAYNIGTP